MFGDFFSRALIAGVGLAAVTGPLGCFVVWRRMAYFGDTMAHSALLGVAISILLSINMTLGVFAVAALVEFRERPITAMLLIVLGAIASLVFAQRRDRLWVTAGIAYAGAMLLAPMFLRADPDYGLFALLLLFAVVWTTDIMAYFTGRAVGGPKLCAAISPKKTWSGAIGGTVCATAIAVVLPRILGAVAPGEFAVAARLVHPGVLVLLGVMLSVLAQLGDLLESWIKRHFGAKDASHLIPGHGGFMDRVDGLVFACFTVFLIAFVHAAATGDVPGSGGGLLPGF